MKILFIILAVAMLAYVVTRRFDLLSVAIVCEVIYNIYCAAGYVFISSHERVGVKYYSSEIQSGVYVVVILQMIILFAYTFYYDRKKKRKSEDQQNSTITRYSEKQLKTIFTCEAIIAYAILIANISRIGLSGLTADKAEVWAQTNLLYSTGQWMSMAIFAYGMRFQKYKFSFIGLIPVLVHLFIGSRAFFAVIAILFFVYHGSNLKDSFKNNVRLYILGFVALFLIMIYKKIFEQVKNFDIEGIRAILKDPDTYMWFFRWGEPRIVLANFNYIIENHIKLDFQAIINRIVVFIPFLDNLVASGNRLMSSIVISQLNSSYGLASNIWGEFYAIGSYPLIFVMYFIWIKIITFANDRITSNSWTMFFLMPLASYYAYYIHRMDFIKVVGNAKMVLAAAISWWAIGCLFKGKFIIHLPVRNS